MSLAVIIGLFLAAHARRKRRVLYFSGLLPSLLVLAMSGSATGWTATVAAPISAASLLVLRGVPMSPTLRFVVAICIFGLLGCISSLLLEPALALLGRDPTLSGRTRLWELAFAYGLDNPILGIGYRAFWVDTGAAAQVMGAVSWGDENIGNGHNAYLDLWLELGVAGVCIFTVLLLSATRRVITGLSTGSDPTALWTSVLAIHLCIYAVTEVVILGHSDLGWMLFAAFYLYMTPELTWARHTHAHSEPQVGVAANLRSCTASSGAQTHSGD